MKLAALFVTLSIVAGAIAATPADPAEALAAKSEARRIARAATTQITVGELEDLKARIKLLQAQNDQLTKKATTAPATRPAEKRRFRAIEIGMTKAELEDFVAHHPSTLKPFNAETTDNIATVTIVELATRRVMESGKTINGIGLSRPRDTYYAVNAIDVKLTDGVVTSVKGRAPNGEEASRFGN